LTLPKPGKQFMTNLKLMSSVLELLLDECFLPFSKDLLAVDSLTSAAAMFSSGAKTLTTRPSPSLTVHLCEVWVEKDKVRVVPRYSQQPKRSSQREVYFPMNAMQRLHDKDADTLLVWPVRCRYKTR